MYRTQFFKVQANWECSGSVGHDNSFRAFEKAVYMVCLRLPPPGEYNIDRENYRANRPL